MHTLKEHQNNQATSELPNSATAQMMTINRNHTETAFQSGKQMKMEATVEIEGQERPALVAESITVLYG